MIMAEQVNSCQTCATNQECCKVLGLKLSRREFEKHFKKHSDRLSFIQYDRMFIVYPRLGLPCPYWDEKKGCGIYVERPIDCRLYPYDLHKIKEKSNYMIRLTARIKKICSFQLMRQKIY